MTKTATINLDSFKQVLREVHDKWTAEQFEGSQEEYNLRGRVVFSNDTFADGIISAPFKKVLKAGTEMRGRLLFSDQGVIDDGVSSQSFSPESMKLLIALAFGPDELKNKFVDQKLKWFEGARTLYQCYEKNGNAQNRCSAAKTKLRVNLDSISVENNNRKTSTFLELADKMLGVARSHDHSYDSWTLENFADLGNEVNEKTRLVGAIPSDTLEGSAKRLELATDMISKALATYSGAHACAELGQCNITLSNESCEGETHSEYGHGKQGTRKIEMYFFHRDKVYEEKGDCQ